MRNKHILFSTVSCMIIFSFEVGAQCVMSQDCTALGYTQATSCVGGVKCPFGNKWYCPNTCDISNFPYTCTGANDLPGGLRCGDKYSSCNCSRKYYVWQDGICQRSRCQIGWIYYIDGTCVTPAAHNTSKVALGVVVYVNADGIGGQVMATKSIGSKIWGGYGTDIPSLPNLSQEAASRDFNSCSNTDKIVAYGSSSTYPAAHTARNYAPTTETKGKWCLPAAGIMTSIYNNQSAVQAGISKLGGEAFKSGVWSSSVYSTYGSWVAGFDGWGGLHAYGKGSDYADVRPVLEF